MTENDGMRLRPERARWTQLCKLINGAACSACHRVLQQVIHVLMLHDGNFLQNAQTCCCPHSSCDVRLVRICCGILHLMSADCPLLHFNWENIDSPYLLIGDISANSFPWKVSCVRYSGDQNKFFKKFGRFHNHMELCLHSWFYLVRCFLIISLLAYHLLLLQAYWSFSSQQC